MRFNKLTLVFEVDDDLPSERSAAYRELILVCVARCMDRLEGEELEMAMNLLESG